MLVGLALAGAAFGVLELIFKQTQAAASSPSRSPSAATAEVITAIPADGAGEVAYVVKGQREQASARAVDGSEIAKRHARRHRESHRLHVLRPPEGLTRRFVMLGRLSSPSLSFLVVPIVFFILILAVAKRYKKVGPNQVMIISGRKHQMRGEGRHGRRHRLPHPQGRRRVHLPAARARRRAVARGHDARHHDARGLHEARRADRRRRRGAGEDQGRRGARSAPPPSSSWARPSSRSRRSRCRRSKATCARSSAR